MLTLLHPPAGSQAAATAQSLTYTKQFLKHIVESRILKFLYIQFTIVNFLVQIKSMYFWGTPMILKH